MDGDVLYFYWYLNGEQGGKVRFTAIKVEGDESSIDSVNYPQGEK
jgi:hypothetical protein